METYLSRGDVRTSSRLTAVRFIEFFVLFSGSNSAWLFECEVTSEYFAEMD